MKSFSKEEIQTLKENKEVLYFYKLPCSLFDSGFQYIIVTDALEPPEKYDNVKYLSSQCWFQRMQNGSLLPIVCTSLGKSYNIKEYVSVYVKPDIIKLRKLLENSLLGACKYPWSLSDDEIIQESLWGIQVIKEGRVNRIDVFKSIYKVTEAFSEFLEVSAPMYRMWRENNE